MKNTIIAAIMFLSLSGCGGGTFVHQRWPILPEVPAPRIEKVVPDTPGIVEVLIRNFNKVATWGRKQEAAIKTYNELAHEHNAKIK